MPSIFFDVKELIELGVPQKIPISETPDLSKLYETLEHYRIHGILTVLNDNEVYGRNEEGLELMGGDTAVVIVGSHRELPTLRPPRGKSAFFRLQMTHMQEFSRESIRELDPAAKVRDLLELTPSGYVGIAVLENGRYALPDSKLNSASAYTLLIAETVRFERWNGAQQKAPSSRQQAVNDEDTDQVETPIQGQLYFTTPAAPPNEDETEEEDLFDLDG